MMRHVPRKRFGQHFLRDTRVIADIVAAIAVKPGDHLVEIGPGEGVLTAPLLEQVDHLQLIELDRDLITRLTRRFPPERISLHQGDVLDFDFASLPGPLRIVGNLPYNISTPLLFHLNAFSSRIVDQHFMLQKEVVDRMAAEPGSKAYGRLSVMLQVAWHIVPLFDVPPEAFEPPPQVQSSVVRMVPRHDRRAAIHDFATFERIVGKAFSQRRKMLRNTLATEFEQGGAAVAAIISGQARAEDISVEQYVSFANHFATPLPAS